MRRFILPTCAAIAFAACAQPSTEQQTNANLATTNKQTPSNAASPTNAMNPSNNMTSTNQAVAPGRITIQEARDLVAQNKAIIVDVRGDSSYNTSHIKDSISIPGADIAARAKELPKDKKIITYCS